MSDGELILACGRSRSGKTAWVRRQIAKGPLLVWDVEGQYGDLCAVATSRQELVRMAFGTGKRRRMRVAYTGALADFGFWADCAFAWARLNSEQDVAGAIVAEELADVTTPGKAPDTWGILLRRGLKYGNDIYAITQRPSESDKTVMGNCTAIHCCSLQRARDRDYMAAELDVPVTDIAALSFERLEYLHRNMKTGQIERGALTFSR